MPFKTFPDFGKELRRDFEVHENCYDCVEFYDGCKGWRASMDFHCRQCNRLPDVLPGTCGQRFPPPRQRPAPAHPAPEPVEQEPAESSRQPAPEPEPTVPAVEVLPPNPPASRPEQPNKTKARICGCGAPLPKGKRLCDGCRTQNRRQTIRQYMQTYRKQRHPAAVGSASGVPFPAAAMPSTQAGSEDRRLTGLRQGAPPFLQTSVLQATI